MSFLIILCANISIRFDHSVMVTQRFKRTMRGIQGALIVASTLQIVLGFSGLWRNVVRFVQNLEYAFMVETF